MRANSKSNIKEVVRKMGGTDRLLLLEAGEYDPLYLTGVGDLRIQAEGRVVFRGGQNAVKLEGCPNVTLIGLLATHAKANGFMVVDCPRFKGSGLRSAFNKSSGFLSGNSSDMLLEGGEHSDNGSHGVYYSQSGDRLGIVGVTANRNGKCAVQVNAHDDKPKKTDKNRDNKTEGLLIAALTAIGNQVTGGGAAINLAGVYSAEIRAFTVLEHLGRHIIALWDDGQEDPEYACHTVRIYQGSGEFRTKKADTGVYVGPGCTKVEVDASAQFTFPEGTKAPQVTWANRKNATITEKDLRDRDAVTLSAQKELRKETLAKRREKK